MEAINHRTTQQHASPQQSITAPKISFKGHCPQLYSSNISGAQFFHEKHKSNPNDKYWYWLYFVFDEITNHSELSVHHTKTQLWLHHQ